MTVQQALARAAGQLSAHPDLRATALADSAALLLHLLALDRAALVAHPERTLDREQQASYQRLIERRLRFEPIQYIVGETDFYGLTLRVTPDVLIPRPETELLVEAVLNRMTRYDGLRVLDVGTGSGAIALALAHALPSASVTAVDISPQALAVARQNAALHRLEERIRWIESDLYGAVEDETFDVIVSNPPYVPARDAATLHPQVRDFEPAQALFAGDSGLDIYARLIPAAEARLAPGGLLALEMGFGLQADLAALLTGWVDLEFLSDLQQIPRVALARRAPAQ